MHMTTNKVLHTSIVCLSSSYFEKHACHPVCLFFIQPSSCLSNPIHWWQMSRIHKYIPKSNMKNEPLEKQPNKWRELQKKKNQRQIYPVCWESAIFTVKSRLHQHLQPYTLSKWMTWHYTTTAKHIHIFIYMTTPTSVGTSSKHTFLPRTPQNKTTLRCNLLSQLLSNLLLPMKYETKPMSKSYFFSSGLVSGRTLLNENDSPEETMPNQRRFDFEVLAQ